jgi:hypothetical protein
MTSSKDCSANNKPDACHQPLHHPGPGIGFIIALHPRPPLSHNQKNDKKGKKIVDLDLPDNAKVVCFYRNGRFILARDETKLSKDDEVVILTHSENISDLKERWEKNHSNNDKSQGQNKQ